MRVAGFAPPSLPAPPHAHMYCERPPSPAGTQEGEGSTVFQSWGLLTRLRPMCFQGWLPSGSPWIPHPKDAWWLEGGTPSQGGDPGDTPHLPGTDNPGFLQLSALADAGSQGSPPFSLPGMLPTQEGGPRGLQRSRTCLLSADEGVPQTPPGHPHPRCSFSGLSLTMAVSGPLRLLGTASPLPCLPPPPALSLHSPPPPPPHRPMREAASAAFRKPRPRPTQA